MLAVLARLVVAPGLVVDVVGLLHSLHAPLVRVEVGLHVGHPVLMIYAALASHCIHSGNFLLSSDPFLLLPGFHGFKRVRNGPRQLVHRLRVTGGNVAEEVGYPDLLKQERSAIDLSLHGFAIFGEFKGDASRGELRIHVKLAGKLFQSGLVAGIGAVACDAESGKPTVLTLDIVCKEAICRHEWLDLQQGTACVHTYAHAICWRGKVEHRQIGVAKEDARATIGAFGESHRAGLLVGAKQGDL